MKNEQHIDITLNHLFREEAGKMVSVLANIFGTEHIELAEDVVQDALVSALETWKYKGLPDNPTAWLYKVAKNKAIDIIRKKKNSTVFDFSYPDRQLLTSEYTMATVMDAFWEQDHMKDNFLGMMYACCHPDISKENQITFILKSLCGFSTKEVARSFITSEDTISKRVYRTKEYFRNKKIPPVIPSSDEIASRTDSVLSAIYLIFNEGYSSTNSDTIIREDLISQALSLCKMLLEHKQTQQPEAYALMALMCFHTARVDSRISPEGSLILLNKQDRSKWDSDLIVAGNNYMNSAAFGDKVTHYHLEAAIAYEHCIAKDYASTNWEAITNYYEQLLKSQFDPVVHLNYCIVLMETRSARHALTEISKLNDNKQMQKYHLYHATLGKLYFKNQQRELAAEHYNIARNLTHSKQEQSFLTKRIAEIFA